MILPPDQIMHPHVARGDLIGLWLAFLLAVCALWGGLQNLIGVLRHDVALEPTTRLPKYDVGTAIIGIAVGFLFVWLSMIWGMPEKRREAVASQVGALHSKLSNPAYVPPGLLLDYVRVGAIGLNDTFDNDTALEGYVDAHDSQAAAMLLRAGALPDKHGENGYSPLNVAIGNDDITDVRLLLAAHADPNLAADTLPLFAAVDESTMDGPASVIGGTSEADPPTEKRGDGHDYTADRQEIVSALLAAGANPDARDERTYTPLMVAAATGQCDLVAALVVGHADQRPRANTGETALDWAREENHPDCVPLLMGGGRAETLAASLIAHDAAAHPARLMADTHLRGMRTPSELAVAANQAEYDRQQPRFRWLRDLLGNGLLSLLLTMIVSTLSYFGHRLWRFLRGDHRPVRWAWIPVGVSSSSGGGDGGESVGEGPSRGGSSGGGGASRDF